MEYELSDGDTVETLVTLLDIQKEQVKIIFRNNSVADFDTRLKDGDQVGFAPAVGAM